MKPGDEAYLAKLLACESIACDKLHDATRKAMVVVRAATSFDNALAVVLANVSEAIVASCTLTRAASLASFVECTGITPIATPVDDSDRGVKAGAFYAKTWAKAVGEAPGAWDAAVEHARAACETALVRLASYEVVRAWNDETVRCVRNAPTLKEFAQRWSTLHDDSVCKLCKKLDGVYADKNGKFNGADPPPLHVMCRCLVIIEVK